MLPNGEGGRPIQRFYCWNFTAGLSNHESRWRGNQTVVFMAFFALGCFCRADSNPLSGDLLEFAAVHFCVRDSWTQQPQGQERKKCWAPGHHQGALKAPGWALKPWVTPWLPNNTPPLPLQPMKILSLFFEHYLTFSSIRLIRKETWRSGHVMHRDVPVSHRVCIDGAVAAIFSLCEHLPGVYKRMRNAFLPWLVRGSTGVEWRGWRHHGHS